MAERKQIGRRTAYSGMEATGGNIVVAEDDRKTSALIGWYLQREGFLTSFVFDGAGVLDLLLPNVDGWQRFAGRFGSSPPSDPHRDGS